MSGSKKEVCLKITTGKDGGFIDVTPYTALTVAIKDADLQYDAVALGVREEGMYEDKRDPTKNVIYTRKSLIKAPYKKSKGRV